MHVDSAIPQINPYQSDKMFTKNYYAVDISLTDWWISDLHFLLLSGPRIYYKKKKNMLHNNTYCHWDIVSR